MTRAELLEALRRCNDRDLLYKLTREHGGMIYGDRKLGTEKDAELVAIVTDRSISLDGP